MTWRITWKRNETKLIFLLLLYYWQIAREWEREKRMTQPPQPKWEQYPPDVFFTHTHGIHPKKDNTIINNVNVKVTHKCVVSSGLHVALFRPSDKSIECMFGPMVWLSKLRQIVTILISYILKLLQNKVSSY